MTKEQVFDEITSTKKWYGGVFSRQTASRIIRKHKLGIYKNYDHLFRLFGYHVNQEKSWIKNK